MNVGLTDTIVQRLGTGTPANPTVNVQISALQMESAEPTSLDGGPLGDYFITLQSTDGTGPASTGTTTITWATPTSGTFSSSLDVYFDIHVGSVSGPIVGQSDLTLTDTDVDWSNLPGPNDALNPENDLLNGTTDANDFFVTSLPELPDLDAPIDTVDDTWSSYLDVFSDIHSDAPLPEPASLGLIGVGAATLLARRPNRKAS
jgi:hypothetical protein